MSLALDTRWEAADVLCGDSIHGLRDALELGAVTLQATTQQVMEMEDQLPRAIQIVVAPVPGWAELFDVTLVPYEYGH